MMYIREPLNIVVSDLRPIITMHVRCVEPVAILPPNFKEDLSPFLLRIDLCHEPRNGDVLFGTLARGIGVHREITSLCDRHQLRPIRRNDEVTASRNQCGFLSV